MGLVDACRGRRVYVDTSILIYAIEGAAEQPDELSG